MSGHTVLHDDQLGVDVDLVRLLLGRSAPALARMPVRELAASGSSNALFRLGDDLLVRLPLQAGGSQSIRKEARWSPYVAPHLPVPCPEVLLVGDPGAGYPEHWSVLRWLPGRTPSVGSGGEDLARDLAGLVRGLRELEVPEAAVADPSLRWYRGGPLVAADGDVRAALAACRDLPGLDLDVDRALRVWDQLVHLPQPAGAPAWFHGDLLAENLLVGAGRLAGVLDLGGLGVGDPSVDLVVAWEVLGPAERETFRDLVGVDKDTWLLGAGWALLVAALTFPYYWHTMPARCRDRMTMARAVLQALG